MAYRPHITDAQQVFTDDEIINLMPKNFIFIAQLIKVENALNLIEAFGGTKIYIPVRQALNVNSKLAQVIGFSNLQLLSDQLGNNHIEIPMGTPITVGMRNRAIRKEASTMSKEKLARKFSVTLRTIRSIVNSEEKLNVHEDPNLDLFSE
ncbi:Mor transcription activator family protein [Acinetobacter venetianus]|uniref:Mor transcription activator family protein n=1 Tax=Acinetobacter venetianus TaxID=52133 RepID=UPI0021506778|nr:Mor transcription activator family protein [Acinetobacter venetianus]MCR4529902.1 transcriptional regulator [Acinetobacter venetianus]